MASINRSLHSCLWKNHQYFNWNGLFICPKKNVCLIKTCALISNSLFHSDELVTFSLAVNAQCQSNMASMKQILLSCPWKHWIYFNWNGLFTYPKNYFAWLKPALRSRIAYFTAMNLWHFRRQSTLNVSQTWLQWNKYWSHVRGNNEYILTEMSYLHTQKNILLE